MGDNKNMLIPKDSNIDLKQEPKVTKEMVDKLDNGGRIVHANDQIILEIEKKFGRDISQISNEEFALAKFFNYKFENIFT